MIRLAVVAFLVMTASSVQAQTRYFLGFELPGIKCGDTLKGFPGEKIRFDVFATMTQSDLPAGEGATGWSIGFAAEGADIHFLPATAASGASCGSGEMIVPVPEFFCTAFIVDPNRIPDGGPLQDQGPQGEGVLDGLALLLGTKFEGNGTFKILKVRAEAAFPEELGATEEVRIYYQDGLQGPGQPVKNGVGDRHHCDPDPCGGFSLGECRFNLQSCPCPGGTQRGGDGDRDGELGLNDAVVLLSRLFRGDPRELPCQGDSLFSPGNRSLFDSNGDGEVDLSDPIHDLTFLFLGGPPHALGPGCLEIPRCQPGACR
ncbi:MAG: hypothetical protein HY717_19815 [Planctomycetes bacterium]|nr:hypothetical protein [Planctomycetota bacterium]